MKVSSRAHSRGVSHLINCARNDQKTRAPQRSCVSYPSTHSVSRHRFLRCQWISASCADLCLPRYPTYCAQAMTKVEVWVFMNIVASLLRHFLEVGHVHPCCRCQRRPLILENTAISVFCGWCAASCRWPCLQQASDHDIPIEQTVPPLKIA